MEFQIRKLESEDADAFKKIRLEALKDYPEMFGVTYDEESKRPNEYFVTWIQNEARPLFGAFVEEENPQGEIVQRIVGMAGLIRPSYAKANHKATIISFYVDPGHRRQGIARGLLQFVEEYGRTIGLEQIQLNPVTTNKAAIELYTSSGYTVFGTEERAFKMNDGTYQDEYWMVKWL